MAVVIKEFIEKKQLVEALEKQKKKKPRKTNSIFLACPCCNVYLDIRAFCRNDYCSRCGQALDWSEVT